MRQVFYSKLKNVLTAVLLCGLFTLPACGYSAKSSLPSSIRTVCVMPFPNKIDFQAGKPNVYVPLMEVKAHDAVVTQFQFNGRLRIATEKDADFVLKGELINYERSAVRYSNNEDVQEYRIMVTMHLTMLDNHGNLLWEEPSFAGDASFFLTGPTASSEAGAVDAAVKDLAKRIVERTVEDW